jgi:zinc transport system substrate-binding protein
MLKIITTIFLAFFPFISFADNEEKKIKIAVSIKPVHSIVSYITDGVLEPFLLVDSKTSPHNYSLKPSSISKISNADIIIYVSDEFETFLNKPIKNYNYNKSIIQLVEVEDMKLLNNRDINLKHDLEQATHMHHNIDPHIWLSPENSIKIAGATLNSLMDKDPTNGSKYSSNYNEFVKKLNSMDELNNNILGKINDIPFIVFHDAYQYFEEYYGLNNYGTISNLEGSGVGARRIKEIEDIIETSKITCVFSEPQFSDSILNNVFMDEDIKIGTIDPLGYEIPAGKDAYFRILDDIVNNVKSCLEG